MSAEEHDEEDIERMIDEILNLAMVRPLAFTPWERTFAESCEDQTAVGHLSAEQVMKLREVYDERCVRRVAP